MEAQTIQYEDEKRSRLNKEHKENAKEAIKEADEAIATLEAYKKELEEKKELE